MSRKSGFTLAELLIALGILGVIATFTIPKLLASQQNTQRKAIFKEMIASIEAVTWQAWQDGQLVPSQNGLYVLRRLNVVKLCDSNADTQGCWSHAMPDPEEMEPGAIMHNGATIGGFIDNVGAGGDNWIFIDWNGATGPNVEGDDQIKLDLCYAADGFCGASNEVRTGTVRPRNGYTASLDLYAEIFQ